MKQNITGRTPVFSEMNRYKGTPKSQKQHIHVHKPAFVMQKRITERSSQGSILREPVHTKERRPSQDEPSTELDWRTSPSIVKQNTLYRETENRTTHTVAITLQQSANERRGEATTGASHLPVRMSSMLV